MAGKVVLAYSGGLDTSVAVRWLQEKYNLEVITLTVDIGNVPDLEAIRQKALKVGAIKALVIDAKENFIKSYVFPAVRADAVYEGQYPLSTALGRPLIVRLLVETAKKEKARMVAHGCTSKGNDQVRIDVGVAALAPELKVIAPAREWKMTREQTIKYAQAHNIPIPVTRASPYSIDENLWGRGIECGVLEDTWNEPPDDIFLWTRSLEKTPARPAYLDIGFERGIPVTLNGRKVEPVALVQKVHELAGRHGIGRIDHVENRLVGIKSREIYEAPAAVVLLKAHLALEDLVLTKEQLRFKARVATEYADLVYNGLWFTGVRQDLAAYVASTQRYVTGTIRVKLFKGNCQVVGRKSPYSLYDYSLATYDKGDVFDHSASPGFIHIWGLPVRTQARVQPEPPE
ncbi:MAG: argininosuccinate synthase [Chloroflexi bacterium RBG_13_51_36]|nr:MAG: argininosuccinate synthase [Chloroflexi bacterium RBG_13_51_36]